MVLVSGEATIFGLSIVDVSGGAAIRDDISLTARRTSLDNIFQTQRRRTRMAAPRPFNVESVNGQVAIEK